MSRSLKLSHSSISTYSDCPKKYEFQYIQRLPTKPKHFFSFGHSIHSALEFMYSGEQVPTIEQVIEYYSLHWEKAGYKSIEEQVKAKRSGEKMIRAYYERYAKEWVKPFSVEAKFDITINHVRVTGIIDRVDIITDNSLHVIDYKTGQSIKVERIEEDEQLTMYQMATEMIHDSFKVGTLSLLHVPTLTWHSVTRHSDRLVEALRKKVVDTAAMIVSQTFPIKPSEHACAWCDFKIHCPAWKSS